MDKKRIVYERVAKANLASKAGETDPAVRRMGQLRPGDKAIIRLAVAKSGSGVDRTFLPHVQGIFISSEKGIIIGRGDTTPNSSPLKPPDETLLNQRRSLL